MQKFRHLLIDERYTIECGLAAGESVNQIARLLKRSPSTILREIQRNITIKGINRERTCDKIVCNGCNKRKFCSQKKIYYNASTALISYKNRLIECRTKPYIDEEKLDYIDEILREKIIDLNQSIFMILNYDKKLAEITSESSIRRYISKGYLSVKNYHLKMVKRRKPKKKKIITGDVEYLNQERAKMRYKRTFSFFNEYLKEHPQASVVEFDSIVGKLTDKKAILTIFFRKYNFQIGLLIDKGNPYSVNDQVSKLFENLGTEVVKKLFEVCLCDNGSEFSIFPKIEIDEFGEKIVNTFYTRPNISTDKSGCERNHREVREILPKRKSLDGLNQRILNNVFSNINNKQRKILGGKTPFALMLKDVGIETIKKLKIKKITRKKVRLSPII